MVALNLSVLEKHLQYESTSLIPLFTQQTHIGAHGKHCNCPWQMIGSHQKVLGRMSQQLEELNALLKKCTERDNLF